MKKIKTINDIAYKDFKQVQDIMLDLDKATTEDVVKAFKVIYHVEDINDYKWEEITAKMNVLILLLSDEIELITKIESDGVKYGFVPNFSEITTGELIDLDSLLVDKNFEGIASILYRPIIKESKDGKYEVSKYKAYDEKLFENAPINFYLGFINFFFKSYQILKSHFLTSTTTK